MQDQDRPFTSTNNEVTQSGITLVLPSLKALKAAKAGNKSKTNTVADVPKKPSRPIKLKPLKGVLTKLIVQIKKKDDYAFFIKPVDATQVPGYSDVIRNPMDFGTMSTKVERGKYRSLEDFASDFRLVTMNAKIFNPPGSIYYLEAERIEAWGLEHISKASAHVIEYETNWNIEIENDDEDHGGGSNFNVNIEDEDISTPRDIDGSMHAASPAPSATPIPTQGRRGPRGSRKTLVGAASTTISESLDAAGRLPGSKGGVGAFPPGTPFSELMVALKIKGKRYKTKKERLRFEKEGPPYCADGSLDYAEMEDPFSVLNVFVPDPPSRPQIYPPSHPPATTLPPALATLAGRPRPGKARRHWTITRTPPSRSRLKDAENEEESGQSKTTVLGDALPGDWGAFAVVLQDDGRAEADVAGIGPAGSGNATKNGSGGGGGSRNRNDDEFWTDEAAQKARDYLIDIVYGGQRGYAYVRSIAEFISRPCEVDNVGVIRSSHLSSAANGMPLEMPLALYVETHLIDRVTHGRHSLLRDIFDLTPSFSVPSPSPVRRTPLSEPGEAYIKPDPDVDVDSNSVHHPHSLSHPPPPPYLHKHSNARFDISPGLARILTLPSASLTLAVLRAPLDMAALLHSPEELARASLLEYASRPNRSEEDTESDDKQGLVDIPPTCTKAGGKENFVSEREAIERALIWSAKTLETLQWRILVGNEVVPEVRSEVVPGANQTASGGELKVENGDEPATSGEGGVAMDVDAIAPPVFNDDENEDPLLKRIRLNLIALAKRAPLDKIAPLPVALVPETIRGMVPTI